MTEREVLSGWKQIGAYLGCGPVAAAGYEKDGLPVYRYKRRVRALTVEIKVWLKKGGKKVYKK